MMWVPVRVPQPSFWAGNRRAPRRGWWGAGGQAGQGEGVSPLGAVPSALAPTPFNGAVLYTIQRTESKGDLNLFQAISPFVLLNS